VIAYLDSSVLLRKILGQSGSLREWGRIAVGVASALAETECLRTLDRRRESVFRLLESVELVDVTPAVLARAAQPLPTELGTLDAIHLATALLWREQMHGDVVMATHDAALATAARASGLSVIGSP
jgi:uncharacterized protein